MSSTSLLISSHKKFDYKYITQRWDAILAWEETVRSCDISYPTQTTLYMSKKMYNIGGCSIIDLIAICMKWLCRLTVTRQLLWRPEPTRLANDAASTGRRKTNIAKIRCNAVERCTHSNCVSIRYKGRRTTAEANRWKQYTTFLLRNTPDCRGEWPSPIAYILFYSKEKLLHIYDLVSRKYKSERNDNLGGPPLAMWLLTVAITWATYRNLWHSGSLQGIGTLNGANYACLMYRSNLVWRTAAVVTSVQRLLIVKMSRVWLTGGLQQGC